MLIGLGALAAVLSAVAVWSFPTAERVTRARSAKDATKTSSTGKAVDPSLFAAGSCVAYGPTSGDRHLTVLLDAGHGGIDPGATGVTESGQTIYEADETLPVELDAMALLRASGYEVVVSRTSNSTVSLLGPGDVADGILTAQGDFDDVAARDVCANLAKADLLVGIYFNSGAPQNAGSVTVYDADRPFSAKSLEFATLLQNDVLARMNSSGWQIPDGGVVSDVGFGAPPLTEAAATYGHVLLLGPAMAGYFSTPSEMPGALIEPLFVTDPFEGTIAASTTGREAIATGVAQAVEQYLTTPAKVSKRAPKS